MAHQKSSIKMSNHPFLRFRFELKFWESYVRSCRSDHSSQASHRYRCCLSSQICGWDWAYALHLALPSCFHDRGVVLQGVHHRVLYFVRVSRHYVAFHLGGETRQLTMLEFGVVLGLWTVEKQITNIHATVQFKAKGTKHILVLRYLHAIITYTITERSDNQMVVTSTDVEILSHIFRDISVDLTYILARQARNYASSTQKKSLGLGPFITELLVKFCDVYNSSRTVVCWSVSTSKSSSHAMLFSFPLF